MPMAALNAGIIQLHNAFIRYGKAGRRLVWLIIHNYRNLSLLATMQIYIYMMKKQKHRKECFTQGNLFREKFPSW